MIRTVVLLLGWTKRRIWKYWLNMAPKKCCVLLEDAYNKVSSCCYTDDSDRSFIVRADKKKNLEILRAKYGSVKDVELQRRNVEEELRRIRTRMIRTLALLSEWTKRRFRKNLEPNMAR